MIEINNLCKKYGDKLALDNISLNVEGKKCISIIGESGSGKTTLLRILAKLESYEGCIKVNDQELSRYSLREYSNYVKMVFQMPYSSFNPKYTIGFSLKENVKEKDKDKIARNMLVKCGLDESFMNKYPLEISGGECQRCAIARALCGKPELILMDEVTSSLDKDNVNGILALIKELKKECLIIFVSHDIGLVKDISDEIVVMKDGRVVERGRKNEVLNNPKSEYTKKLLYISKHII